MISYQSRWLKYVELWFDESCPLDDIDVVFRFRSAEPVRGASNEEFYTLVVDLTRSEDEIVVAFHRNTRSKIRRAEAEDGLTYTVLPAPSQGDLDRFFECYAEFACRKGVAAPNRSYIERQRAAGALVLSHIDNADHTLVWHAHLRIGASAVLSHSASLYRGRDKEFQSLVGRANRLHHLRDMLYFKATGCLRYDFGGWYAGTEDQERLMINRFKAEFGGEKVLQFNAVQHRTWRAKVLKSVRRLM